MALVLKDGVANLDVHHKKNASQRARVGDGLLELQRATHSGSCVISYTHAAAP